MKKISLTFAIALATLTMIFTGCKKEADTVTLGCYIDASSKTYIGGDNGRTPMWNVGDCIAVNGLTDNHTLTSADINGNSAQLHNVQRSSSYLAFYPYDLARNGLTTVLLEEIQEYKEVGSGNTNQVVEAPMAAYSTSTTLTFRNLCGLIKVHFTNNTNDYIPISEITVTGEDVYLCGYSNLHVSDSVVDPLAVSGGSYASNSVALKFLDSYNNYITYGMAGDTTKDFYIYLPGFESKNITVILRKSATEYASFTGTVSLAHNTIATINFDDEDIIDHSTISYPTGAIHGQFTINSNGDKVCFSQGNLRCTLTAASTGTWSFAENQWDFIGNNPGNTNLTSTPGTLSSYPGTVDYFGWSANNSSNYYGVSPSGAGLGSEFKDWGTNPITNGGNTANQWRTLEASEWEYITSNRSDAYKYLKTNVNGVNGMILFPDNFSIPSELPDSITNAIENYKNNATYSSTSISGSNWTLMESLGCVFLPAAGEYGDDGYSNSSDQTDLYYWLATPQPPISAHFVNLGASTSFGIQLCKYPVRLVQDYTSSTSSK